MDIKAAACVPEHHGPKSRESLGKDRCTASTGQVRWLEGVLAEAKSKSMSALLFFHVPPAGFNHKGGLERAVTQAGCVRGIFCGHNHSNSRAEFGGVPVFVRIGNASSPMGYSMIHVYPDGRITWCKSQIHPYHNFNTQTLRPGLQRPKRPVFYGRRSERPAPRRPPRGRNEASRSNETATRVQSGRVGDSSSSMLRTWRGRGCGHRVKDGRGAMAWSPARTVPEPAVSRGFSRASTSRRNRRLRSYDGPEARTLDRS